MHMLCVLVVNKSTENLSSTGGLQRRRKQTGMFRRSGYLPHTRSTYNKEFIRAAINDYFHY